MNLSYWLQANGFVDNPFSPGSLHAETDNLSGVSLHNQYLQREDIDLLLGSFDAPGYRFIVAGPGGGKTAVRLQIHMTYEKIDQFSDKPQALIIDYVEHDYPTAENEVSHHINRILHIAEQKLGHIDLVNERKLVRKSPKKALEHLVDNCKKLGYEGVYCLVDNISPQKTLSMAIAHDLFDINGFILKFFVPNNPVMVAEFAPAFIEYPPYFVEWSADSLSQSLDKRLTVFLDPKLISSTVIPGVSFLCESHISADVQDCFIKVGMYGGGPGLMWDFGNCLIEEHVQSVQGITEFINRDTFSRARRKLFDKWIRFNPGQGIKAKENFDRDFSIYAKTSTRVKRKAKVFIHCLEDDKDVIYRTLYQNLDADNYRPWMASLDLVAGENRKYVIESEIKKSDFFIPCLSSKSVNARGDFRRFLMFALEIKQKELLNKDIFIIPFIIEKCDLPHELVDFESFDRNNKDYYSSLLKAIEKGMVIKKEIK